MSDAERDAADLRSRLVRYPADRYPAEHATIAFHLGTAHLQRNQLPQALRLLQAAVEVFGRAGMRAEVAKATLMRGLALRADGQLPVATEALAEARRVFTELGQDAEEAASSFNLGLVLGQQGESVAAREALVRAKQVFLRLNRSAQAGSAARELGTLMLADDEAAAAVAVLVEALELGVRGGDATGAGAAANVLGLAHLALGNDSEACSRFAEAAELHPRSIRPGEHAMATANLSLALHRGGYAARARLAALQAQATPHAAPPVLEQCARVLAELGESTGDELGTILAQEPAPQWSSILRKEVLRWLVSDESTVPRAAAEWVGVALSQPGRATELNEALLGVLLELPAEDYLRLVDGIVGATATLAEADAAQFRASTRSAMARFPLPQLQRMSATFDQVAGKHGEPARWS